MHATMTIAALPHDSQYQHQHRQHQQHQQPWYPPQQHQQPCFPPQQHQQHQQHQHSNHQQQYGDYAPTQQQHQQQPPLNGDVYSDQQVHLAPADNFYSNTNNSGDSGATVAQAPHQPQYQQPAPHRRSCTVASTSMPGKPSSRPSHKNGPAGQRKQACSVPGLPGKVHAVFAGELAPVFMIPREDFVSAPRGYSPAAAAGKKSSVAAATGRPFELCRGFATHGVCAAARDCPHFHAVLARSVAHAPHIRDAAAASPPSDFFDASQLVPAQRSVPVYKTVDEQPDEPGITPYTNGDRVIEWLPIQSCLKTLAPLEKWAEHASQSTDYLSAANIDGGDKAAKERPLSEVASSHCAHWVRTGYCHFGATCRFVHAIRRTTEHGNVPLSESVLETQQDRLPPVTSSGSAVEAHDMRSAAGGSTSLRSAEGLAATTVDAAAAAAAMGMSFERMVPPTSIEAVAPESGPVPQLHRSTPSLNDSMTHCNGSRAFPYRHDPYSTNNQNGANAE